MAGDACEHTAGPGFPGPGLGPIRSGLARTVDDTQTRGVAGKQPIGFIGNPDGSGKPRRQGMLGLETEIEIAFALGQEGVQFAPGGVAPVWLGLEIENDEVRPEMRERRSRRT